jgi:hypothetical protein
MLRTASLTLAALLALALAPLGRTPVAHAGSLSLVTLPSIPPPVPVSLDAASTVFMALDFVTPTCANRPACAASLPAVQAGLAAARSAGVPVLYSVVGGNPVDPSIAPQPGDVVLTTFGPDKFYNTNLDDILKADGASTLVITGTAADGAVLYTAYEAAQRGYTVVVAEDGISSNTDFATFLTEWQLLNGPGTVNPDNTPLQPKAVTLSRTDLISYVGTASTAAVK